MEGSSSLLLKQLSICLIRFGPMKFQVCHKHCTHSCCSLLQCHPAGRDSETGNRNLRETVYLLCTNMVIAVSSPPNLLQILVDFFFSDFFFCRAQWLAHSMSGWKQSSGNSAWKSLIFMSLSPPNWITVTHFLVGSPARTSRDCNTFRTALQKSWGVLLQIRGLDSHPWLTALASHLHQG